MQGKEAAGLDCYQPCDFAAALVMSGTNPSKFRRSYRVRNLLVARLVPGCCKGRRSARRFGCGRISAVAC